MKTKHSPTAFFSKYLQSLFYLRSEMTSRSSIAIFSAVILVFVIILALVFQWKNQVKIYNIDCGKETCMRVCCTNSTCLQADDIKRLEQAEKLPERFKIIEGRPDCRLYVEEDWSFEKVNIE
jgi:hypothetical protein